MAHSAKVLADSISPDGVRLTTLEVTFPRIVLAEFNTHRTFSRNSASSRAIPVEKMINMVEDNPYIPTHWGKNQKGMQAEVELSKDEQIVAALWWLGARDKAVESTKALLAVGVHKQITNRLLEPFMWHTVIVTASEFSNFFNLRCNPMAHPEIKLAAELMRDAMNASTPTALDYGQWHTPLVSDEEAAQILEEEELRGWTTCDHNMVARVSVGRCARVSYLTHDGKRDPVEDVKLADRLLEAGHMSPFEHVARPLSDEDLDDADRYWSEGWPRERKREQRAAKFSGNFRGWVSYRKQIPHEEDILGQR